MKRYLQLLTKGVSFLLFLLCWNELSTIINNKLLFPNVWDIFISLKNICRSDIFLKIVLNTLKKVGISISVSILLAILVAILAYRYKYIKILFVPYVAFLKSIPTIAVIILVLIWAKTEYVAIIVGVVILFPILYDNIISGIERINTNLIKMSQTFKVSLKEQLLNIYIPGVYFNIAGGLHSLIGLTFKVIIAGEVLAQEDNSIGGEIFLNKIYLEPSKIFAWVIVVIIINFIIDQSIVKINNRLFCWR